MIDNKQATDEAEGAAPSEPIVKQFRQILLWPIYLMPIVLGDDGEDHWHTILQRTTDNPWREVEDEFTGDPAEFQERHYNEFTAFLPPVQRFLYGQGIGKSVNRIYGESPIRVMRRGDVSQARVTLAGHATPVTLGIAHIDLYFFFDIDVAMLALEVSADDLPLGVCQDLMFQFGRAYPAFWDADGRAGDCPRRVEWLGAGGEVLAASDFDDRQKYLSFTCRHRAPGVASHWEFLLRPLVLHHTDQIGEIRYRQLEYYRMPLMALLGMDDPSALSQSDTMRLALAMGSGDAGEPAFTEAQRAAFEQEHSYDRMRGMRDGRRWTSTRYWTTGHTLILTGEAGSAAFADLERGTLARFRHQHFVLFMIAHFHKAALLMFSDRLAFAVSRLNVGEAEAVKAFRAETREALETFLRFTHRYWFHQVSDQAQIGDLFALCRRHLGTDELYEDVRQEVQDMSQYLEADAMRRQNESVVRLTVVTTLGLIGTVATGFLGMNLFAWGDEDPLTRFILFWVVFIPVAVLTFYTVMKSQGLSSFLDAMSNEQLRFKDKWRAFKRIW